MTDDQTSLTRVLLVEDEEDIRAVAELALETVGGFQLCACASGQQALTELAGFRPQVILLDVMMPGMDGPTTLRAIREVDGFEDTPAIFMTAKVQPDEVQAYLDMGAAGVIPKPFDPMVLSDQIREIWAGVVHGG